MSFRLFIYYCALCGGWAAFVGWAFGLVLSPSNPLGMVGIKGMWLGMFIAFGLGLVDALWNLSLTQVHIIFMRVSVAIMVGCVAGLLGGVVGQFLFSLVKWPLLGQLFYVFGWTITGLLVGTSVGVFEVLASVVQQQNYMGSVKKLVKGLIGGTAGGIIGGTLSMILNLLFATLFSSKEQSSLWSPSAWGFVALGMCIGLLIGLAQVFLMEAWVKVESGRRAGREMILTRERTTIGRAEVCDIGLFGDNQIEKLHAIILQAGNRYYVEDENTPAGTLLNDAPIQGRVALKTGDRIRVGGSVLSFHERAKR
jgi:Inner membrane component of T3SS, cytoplasmic domain